MDTSIKGILRAGLGRIHRRARSLQDRAGGCCVAALVLLSTPSIDRHARAFGADSPTEQVRIEQLVPPDAWLVLGVDNLGPSMERWNATPLGKWFHSEPVRALLKEHRDAADEKNKARMKELGVDEHSWSLPESIGIGLYLSHDDTLDADLAQSLIYASWGGDADKVNTLFEAVFTEMQKEDIESVTSVEIRGKPAKAIRVVDKDKKPAKTRRGGGTTFVPDDAFDHIETIYFVRSGNRFLLGTVKQDLDEALGVFEGVARKSVADNVEFKRTLDSVGRGDAWAVILMSALSKAAGEGASQMRLIQPYMQTLFGDTRGMGVSLSSDATGAQFQLLWSIVIEGERTGLLGLLNPPKSPSPPPRFVTSDSRSYATVQVQFGEIMKLIETLLASMPEEVSAPMDASMQQYGPDLTRVLSKLGPDMHIMRRKSSAPNSLNEETSADNEERAGGSMYAIRCSEEQSLMALLNLFLPQMGYEPRDFNGNTIFDTDMTETSFGFGPGWFFSGKNLIVESVLRAVTPPYSQDVLSETPVCRQALADLGGAPVLCWGFQDILVDFSEPTRVKGPKGVVTARVDSGELGTIGVESPMDEFSILFRDDKSQWRSAMGPNVFSVSQEPYGLITKMRILPPTAK